MKFFSCLKELVINASKANYKILFEKHFTEKEGVTTKTDYRGFLNLFIKEIEEHGNRRLLPLAKKEDKYINIIFQSTHDSIAVWVVNNSNLSLIEKTQLLDSIEDGQLQIKRVSKSKAKFKEGAGYGINLVLTILNQYSTDPNPLKVVFSQDSVKIGFEIKRSDIEGIIK